MSLADAITEHYATQAPRIDRAAEDALAVALTIRRGDRTERDPLDLDPDAAYHVADADGRVVGQVERSEGRAFVRVGNAEHLVGHVLDAIPGARVVRS